LEIFRSVRWRNFGGPPGATVKNFDTLGRFRKANETAQEFIAFAGSVAIEIFPQQIACLMRFAASGGNTKSKRRTIETKNFRREI
jgi:hypothetical protein